MKQYLGLTPQEFDQEKEGGWRIIFNQGLVDYVMSGKKDSFKILKAISIMKFYVDYYQFEVGDICMKQLIKFHIGQLFAYIGNYDNALLYFIGLQNEGYDKVGIVYLDFTIKFLQRNIRECEYIIKGLSDDRSVINIETMQRMIQYKEYDYLESYSGMSREQLRQWIIENKK